MKRQVTIFALIAILWVIIPGLPILAKPTRIPHENPATTAESTAIVSLISSYSYIINLISSQQCDEAQDILGELMHADIPEEIKNTAEWYGGLYQQLLDKLEKLEPLSDTVTELLDSGRVQEAGQILADSATDIRDAEALVRDIEKATDIASHELSTFTSPVSSLTEQASALMESNLEQLNKLLDRFRSLHDRLFERYVQTTGLTTTELSFSIMPNSAFVGDTVTAHGRLTGRGSPLPGKEITLSTGGKPIITDENGFCTTDINLPYIYDEKTYITAFYRPSGKDTDVYLASQSPPVTVETRFYRTMIELSAPDTIYPGQPFTVSGRISPATESIIRKVRIILNDNLLAEAMVTESFSLNITPPEQTTVQRHELTAAVTPQGRYSGAIENRTLHTSTLPIYLDMQAPRITFLPNAASISGRVYADAGPITDTPVIIYLGDSAITTRTAGDGSFTASVGVPLDLFFIAGRPLTVIAAPAEPWYGSIHTEQRLYTVNLFILEMMTCIFLAVWIFAITVRYSRIPEPTTELQAEFIELPATSPAPLPKTRPTGIKGRIIGAYRRGLEAVEKVTGAILAPNLTLREFLKIAKLPAPTTEGRFIELTDLAETALYSGQNLPENTATKAEELASDIHEELHRGAA